MDDNAIGIVIVTRLSRRAEWGLSVLYSQRQRSAKPWASATVAQSSVLRNSTLNRLVNDSAKPFCHGDPGSMQAVVEVGVFYWTVLAPDIVNSGREEQGSISV
jgi:hypothetical protein